MKVNQLGTKKLASIIGGALGFLVLLAYLNFAAGALQLSRQLTILLAFAIGPIAIVAVLSLSKLIGETHDSFTLRVGTVFLIVAFALLNLMIVVQQALFLNYDSLLASTQNDQLRESLRLSIKVVNPVHFGIDVSFDIFYCIGLILFSSVMYRHPGFGKLLGFYGILSAAGLLAFNLSTFPKPPASAGLVDLGPATGLWWIWVIIQERRMRKRKSNDNAVA